jgi:hypothetical protein
MKQSNLGLGEDEMVKNEFAPWDEALFKERFDQTLVLLEELLNLEPHKRYQEVDVAERAIAQLRDVLIGKLRSMQESPEKNQTRTVLERVNVALSLVVALEYPATGIQQGPLQHAYDYLKETSLEGL